MLDAPASVTAVKGIVDPTTLASDANGVRLATARLRLETARPSDALALAQFYRRNRTHLERWTPGLGPEFEDTSFWRARIERFDRERIEGVSLRLFLFSAVTAKAAAGAPRHVLGAVTFSDLLALPEPSARIGYVLDAARQGRGLMREALSGALEHATFAYGLRRVTATYDVENERSARVLARLGFVQERLLPQHLFTAGALRDHVEVALAFPSGVPRPDAGVR